MYDNNHNAYSLAEALRQYPAGYTVAVALNGDNEICYWRETPVQILSVIKIRQTDTCVFFEYGSTDLERRSKTVYDVLSAIVITDTITDITYLGREVKRGIFGLFGKNIPQKEYRKVQTMLCGTDLNDYERIYDISEVKLIQNKVCLFG